MDKKDQIYQNLYSEYGPEPTMGKKGQLDNYSNARFLIYAIFLLALMWLCIALSLEARTKGINFNMEYILAENWVGSRQYYYLLVADIVFAGLAFFNLKKYIDHKTFKRHGVEGLVVGYRKNGKSGSVTNMDVTVEAYINGHLEYVRANVQGVTAKTYYPLGSKVTIYRMGQRWYL